MPFRFPESSFELFQLVVQLTVMVSVLVVIAAVVVNFVIAKQRGIAKEKRSIVATGTMAGFFVVYYFIVRFHIGEFAWPFFEMQLVAIGVGLALIVLGSVVNVLGRVSLGANWANHIRLFNDHTLIANGPFKYVRHPLYASLIWMFVGGSLVFSNIVSFIATILVFVPSMYYRAKQEEEVLQARFPEYVDYAKRVGMFIPRRW